jgi:hypothetical protein
MRCTGTPVPPKEQLTIRAEIAGPDGGARVGDFWFSGEGPEIEELTPREYEMLVASKRLAISLHGGDGTQPRDAELAQRTQQVIDLQAKVRAQAEEIEQLRRDLKAKDAAIGALSEQVEELKETLGGKPQAEVSTTTPQKGQREPPRPQQAGAGR